MKPGTVLLVLGMVVLMAIVGCDSSEPQSDAGSSPGPSDNSTQGRPTGVTEASPEPSPETSPDLATPMPGILPADFNLDDYLNGAEITNLMVEVGDERAFPAELLPTSPELPHELAQSLVEGYLNDTRIVIIKQGFRDLRVEAVFDYCDNGTRQLQYIRTVTGPSILNNPLIFPSVGWVNEWLVVHTELTPWNEPYIAGIFEDARASYYTRGWDGVAVLRFKAPGSDGLARLQAGSGNDHIRVFDHPDCLDPRPVLEYSPDQWSLIGLGKMLEIPDWLSVGQPQQDPERVVQFWDEAFSDLATFSNLNGTPFLYMCANHRGVILGREHAKLREPFTWRIEDGSDVAPNAVWIRYEFDNTNWGIGNELLFVEAEYNPFRWVVAAHIEECSVDRAFDYVDSFVDEIDWWQDRPATPVPSS